MKISFILRVVWRKNKIEIFIVSSARSCWIREKIKIMDWVHKSDNLHKTDPDNPHTVIKVNFSPKNQFWHQHFHEFFTQNCFWQFFSWNQRCLQVKSTKPQHFHEFFTQKNRQFFREIKVEFLDKKWRFRTVWFDWTFDVNSKRFFSRKHWQTWNDKFMHLKDLIWKTHIYMATLYVDGTDICPWTKLHRKQTKGIENFEKMNVFSPNLPLPQAL